MVECEDAIATNEIDYRFAVADGATESYGARKWARYLATSWVSSTSRGADDAAYLTGLARVAEHFRSKQPKGEVPWYVTAKAEQGSFAAVLGVAFLSLESGYGYWEAVSVGDCCLVHLRADGSKTSFPLEDPDQFGSHPSEIGSAIHSHETLLPFVRRSASTLLPDDILLLMTDAIAQWYLRYCFPDASAAAEFQSALTDGREAVAQLIERERLLGRLRNDDVAVLRIRANS